jgi:hypothetical protein
MEHILLKSLARWPLLLAKNKKLGFTQLLLIAICQLLIDYL